MFINRIKAISAAVRRVSQYAVGESRRYLFSHGLSGGSDRLEWAAVRRGYMLVYWRRCCEALRAPLSGFVGGAAVQL